MNKPYIEKLKDPRWQKKRLEILERDKWQCIYCRDDKQTLVVHHLKYESGNPWEIDNKYLITLCQRCHEDEREERPEAEKYLLKQLKERGFLWGDVLELGNGIEWHETDYGKFHLVLILETVLYDKERQSALRQIDIEDEVDNAIQTNR